MQGRLNANVSSIEDVRQALGQLAFWLDRVQWGTFTMPGGSPNSWTIDCSFVTGSSVILLGVVDPSATVGSLSISSITENDEFVVTSSSSLDESVVAYLVIGI